MDERKYAVITGGSSGLGPCWASQLAAEGYDIILAARRVELMQSVAARITSSTGRHVIVLAADLSQPHASEKLWQEASAHGHICVLVNNAGRGSYNSFLKVPLSEDAGTIELNITSLVTLTKLAAAHMLSHGLPSRIINVASIAAYLAPDHYAVYAASKAFVKSYTHTVASELRHSQIKVICVHPGGTRTEFMERAAQQLSSHAEMSLMSPDLVVKQALQASRTHKSHLTTGLLNKVIVFLPRLLPETLAQRMVSYFFGKFTSMKEA